MPSEERDAEMLGVPVWRYRGFAELWCYAATDNLDAIEDVGEPGRWHAEPVAVAMVDHIRALEDWIAADLHGGEAGKRVAETKARLDAALGEGRNG